MTSISKQYLCHWMHMSSLRHCNQQFFLLSAWQCRSKGCQRLAFGWLGAVQILHAENAPQHLLRQLQTCHSVLSDPIMHNRQCATRPIFLPLAIHHAAATSKLSPLHLCKLSQLPRASFRDVWKADGLICKGMQMHGNAASADTPASLACCVTSARYLGLESGNQSRCTGMCP